LSTAVTVAALPLPLPRAYSAADCVRFCRTEIGTKRERDALGSVVLIHILPSDYRDHRSCFVGSSPTPRSRQRGGESTGTRSYIAPFHDPRVVQGSSVSQQLSTININIVRRRSQLLASFLLTRTCRSRRSAPGKISN